ncbi:histone H1-like [Megalops cyprinoides]|uniref:histone H1-like n=1 Tax=Megalops cyprinoides TaxID=118141 RepID=UPI001863D345|nr:histone H1-like [Megalops cyprinoides]
MSAVAPAVPLPPAAKTPKKRSSKPKKTGPTVSDLILKAVSASKARSGVSLVALKKALAAGGYDVVKNNSRIKLALRRLVTKGDLVQVKGTGASGSFKISKKQAVAKKKKAVKKKKPAAKAKKPAAKKRRRSAAKKPSGAKKTPKKAKKPAAAKKAKSPKKAKKPKAKKARSPRKAKAAKRRTSKAKAPAKV